MKLPRPKKCKVCKEVYQPERTCTQVCGYQCAMKLVKLVKDKKEKKVYRQKKRKYWENDKDTRRKAAVFYCHKYIRLRDQYLPCISCGTTKTTIKYDAGHYITAGSCTALKFNEYNINKQCSVNCNQHKSGNRVEYKEGLIKKYGQSTVDFLEGPQPLIKITAQFYKEVEEKYKKKYKELEDKMLELRKYTDARIEFESFD